MNNISNNLTLEEPNEDLPQSSTSATTAVTMLLLIAGLLLTGTMIFNHALATEGSTDLTQAKNSFFDFSFLSEIQAPSFSQEKQDSSEASIASESGISTFFNKNESQVRWPKLRLLGFGSANSTGGSFAIINGKQVHPGQLIEGKARLIEIRKHDVIVEYKGEKRILTMNN